MTIDPGDRRDVSALGLANGDVGFHENTIIMGMRRPFHKRAPISLDDPQAEQLAWLMDSSIGIGRYSIGLDALVGIIPGFGDLLTSMIGFWIVLRAMQGGVHRAAILR